MHEKMWYEDMEKKIKFRPLLYVWTHGNDYHPQKSMCLASSAVGGAVEQ